MMCLSLGKEISLPSHECAEPACFIQIPLILRGAFVYVLREHPVVGGNDEKP